MACFTVSLPKPTPTRRCSSMRGEKGKRRSGRALHNHKILPKVNRRRRFYLLTDHHPTLKLVYLRANASSSILTGPKNRDLFRDSLFLLDSTVKILRRATSYCPTVRAVYRPPSTKAHKLTPDTTILSREVLPTATLKEPSPERNRSPSVFGHNQQQPCRTSVPCQHCGG